MSLLELHAGPLTMYFDRDLAFLRHVRMGDRELVRGVIAAIRDQDWNTIPFTIHDADLRKFSDRFDLSFLARCDRRDIQFDWRGTLWGTPEGTVGFRFEGEARSTFLKNRIGLCVLHPIRECAGENCRVVHTDGTVTESQFPRLISPQQPFLDIRSVTHAVGPGLDVRVTFDGEVFEMEDQRNWTDASYKTYSTPLALPYPVEIAAGTKVQHEVTIDLIGTKPEVDRTPRRDDQAVQAAIDWSRARPRPPIGFALTTSPDVPSTVIEHLRHLGPDHLRVDLHLGRAGWMGKAGDALELAEEIGTRLEVALFTSDAIGASWQACLNLFRRHRQRLARWLVFDPAAKATPPALANAAAQALEAFDATVPVVVGTDIYFAELNRHRPPVRERSQVCFSINPQVHAFDNLSIGETLEAQRAAVESAHAIFDRPVVISPVTLRPRFNPNATAGAPSTEPDADPRQSTGFAAAWTAGVLAQLATHAEVASLTFYEMFGPRGIMGADGTTFPMFSVFESLRACRSVCEATTSRPLSVAAFGLIWENNERAVLLANMSDVDQAVALNESAGVRTVTLAPESVRLVSVGKRVT